MTDSVVESPINSGSSDSGLALFCATRIHIRLNAIPAAGKVCLRG